MLDDGRFAFGGFRCWGNLRKLIDQAMQEKNNQGPLSTISRWMAWIYLACQNTVFHLAINMTELHKHNIICRDLKVANVVWVFHWSFWNEILEGTRDIFGFEK